MLPVLAAFISCYTFAAESGAPTPARPSAMHADAVGSDMSVLENFDHTIFRLFTERKFDELDAMANSERSEKERFPGGGWKLYAFYDFLRAPVLSENRESTDADREDHIARLQEWSNLNPSSITARVALAEAYRSYAWKARGNGYADKVTEEGWHLFRERNALAKATLKSAETLPAKCPNWYFLMMEIANEEGWSPEETRALFEKSFSVEPEYYYVSQAYSNYLLPKWNGEPGDSERFAEEISKRIGGTAGDIAYFEIARDMDCSVCGYSEHLKNMNWEKILRGYAASEERYGVSTLKINGMAYASVQLLDISTAQNLFDRIGENWHPLVWGKKENFDKAKEWVTTSEVFKTVPIPSGGPMPKGLQAIIDVADANSDTPKGEEYAMLARHRFGTEFNDRFIECMRTAGEDFGGSFAFYVHVGKTGNVMEVKAWPQTKISDCVQQGIPSATFPEPPSPSYWVKLDMSLPKTNPFANKTGPVSHR